jgi:D-glycero-D-manno-heptose 1,7-bisphosphate phosphatase
MSLPEMLENNAFPSTRLRERRNGREVRVVLLDRDGVLNRKMPEGSYLRSCDELELLPGVADAIRLLNESGIVTIVVTNQRGIALGHYTEEDLESIHCSMRAQLQQAAARIDAIYHCPHDYNQCDCRKPKTGMLEQALRDFPVASRENTVMVGDSASDMAAGRAFGIPTILVASNQQRPVEDGPQQLPADAYAVSLLDAVEWIVSLNSNREHGGISPRPGGVSLSDSHQA